MRYYPRHDKKLTRWVARPELLSIIFCAVCANFIVARDSVADFRCGAAGYIVARDSVADFRCGAAGYIVVAALPPCGTPKGVGTPKNFVSDSRQTDDVPGAVRTPFGVPQAVPPIV